MRPAELARAAASASLFRFAAGGVFSIAVSLGVTALFHEVFGVSEPTAAAVGLICTMAANFLVLRYAVFAGSRMPPSRQLVLFIGSAGAFRLVEYLAFLVLNVWLHIGYLIALPAVRVLSFFIKFFFYDRVLFARAGEGSESGEATAPPLPAP